MAGDDALGEFRLRGRGRRIVCLPSCYRDSSQRKTRRRNWGVGVRKGRENTCGTLAIYLSVCQPRAVVRGRLPVSGDISVTLGKRGPLATGS